MLVGHLRVLLTFGGGSLDRVMRSELWIGAHASRAFVCMVILSPLSIRTNVLSSLFTGSFLGWLIASIFQGVVRVQMNLIFHLNFNCHYLRRTRFFFIGKYLLIREECLHLKTKRLFIVLQSPGTMTLIPLSCSEKKRWRWKTCSNRLVSWRFWCIFSVLPFSIMNCFCTKDMNVTNTQNIINCIRIKL